MRTGHNWLIAGVAGALLMAPGIAKAQGTVRGPAGGDNMPAAPGPVRSSSTGPIGSFNPPAPIRAGQPVSVLVFPFGYAADMAAPPGTPPPMPDPNATAPAADTAKLSAAQEQAAAELTAHVKAGLLSSPSYSVATYHPQSSLIQRGRKDDILRPDMLTDLISPATGAVDAEKAKLITYRLGVQAYMVGTLELKEDPKTNTVEITLETQIIDSSNGQVIHSAAVSGAAAGAEGVPLDAIRDRAAQDTAQKALPALGIQMVTLAVAPSAQEKDADKKKSEADKKAERDAKKKAEADKARAEKEARDQKKADDKARHDAQKGSSSSNSGTPAGDAAQSHATLIAATAPAPAPAASAPASAAPSGTVTGYANTAGQPIPYGYAGEAAMLKPKAHRGIHIPDWLGIAGFLTGISFLL